MSINENNDKLNSAAKAMLAAMTMQTETLNSVVNSMIFAISASAINMNHIADSLLSFGGMSASAYKLPSVFTVSRDAESLHSFLCEHRSSLRHLREVGYIHFIWCHNCGPWIDDDSGISAEICREMKIREAIRTIRKHEAILYLTPECPACSD